ncbi:MAG: hypothetical protein KBT09_03255 [Bacteroidales bacterium]|nr:hypothetical protein [Candidatus Sodaliphilus fimicaballi]
MKRKSLVLALAAFGMSLCSQAQVVTDLSKSSPVAMPQDESVELYLPTNDYQKQELGDRTVYVKKVKPMAGTTATVTFNYVIKDPNLASPMSLTIYNPEQKVLAVDTKGASNTVTASIPVGKYDMHAMFKGKPVGNYIVFKENVEINGDTTLNFDMSEATEPIRFKAYDDNGTLFNLDEYENGAVAVPGNCTSYRSYSFFALKGMGVVHTIVGGTYRVKGYDVDYYVNKVSDRFSLLHTSNMKSLANNQFYFFKYPEIKFAAATVNTDPANLKFYSQKFLPTPKGEGEPNSHIYANRLICSYNGDILASAKNEYKSIILSGDYKNEMYVDLAEPEDGGWAVHCSPLMGDILVTGQYKHIIGVPVAGNKVQGLHFINFGFDLMDGLVIPVGGGVSKVYPGHPVLSFDDKYVDSYVYGGGRPQLLSIKPKDYDGNKSSKLRVFTGRYGEIIESGINTCTSSTTTDGDFTNFTYVNNNVKVGELEGKTELVLHNHALGTEDYAAPSIQALRFLTTEGEITEYFDYPSQGVLEFAAADWKYHHDAAVAANRWYDCSTIASVKVLYAAHGTDEWNELEATEDASAFTMPAFGYLYRASLAPVNAEGWFDLKVVLEDPSGNVSTETFGPAFFVSEATAVNDVNANKAVASVKYYNIAGMEVSAPAQGVNIQVTKYVDGSMSSVKFIK